MNYLNQLVLLKGKIALLSLIVVIAITSCKKEEIKSVPFASLTLVNVVTGGIAVKIGNAQILTYNNEYRHIGLSLGEQNLYVWPEGDSLHPYFVYNKLNVKQEEAHTLFVFGVPTATEGLIVKENIPYRTDSSAGIRFINLSPNSTPLNITLSTSTTVNEVNNLAYKDYTDFKTYAGNYNSTYTFQVRAANNPGTVLTSITLSAAQVPRFANSTLVIRGLVGSTPGIGITRVNHDR